MKRIPKIKKFAGALLAEILNVTLVRDDKQRSAQNSTKFKQKGDGRCNPKHRSLWG
jgi:hypothetical protein